MSKEYELFLHKDQELKEGEQIVEIRDCDTFEYKKVRAVISKDVGEGLDKLWIRVYETEIYKERAERQPKPWGIKILEEVEKERVEVVKRVSAKLSKDSVIRSLLERKASGGD